MSEHEENVVLAERERCAKILHHRAEMMEAQRQHYRNIRSSFML